MNTVTTLLQQCIMLTTLPLGWWNLSQMQRPDHFSNNVSKQLHFQSPHSGGWGQVGKSSHAHVCKQAGVRLYHGNLLLTEGLPFFSTKESDKTREICAHEKIKHLAQWPLVLMPASESKTGLGLEVRCVGQRQDVARKEGAYQACGKQLFHSPVKMSTTQNCQILCLLLANDEIKCGSHRNILNRKQNMQMLHNRSCLGFLLCLRMGFHFFVCNVFEFSFFPK